MKIPIYRKSTRITDNDSQCGEYSKYASIEDSARDLVYYLDSINMPTTFNSISMYGNYIQNYDYAEDNDYVRKLGKFYEKL